MSKQSEHVQGVGGTQTEYVGPIAYADEAAAPYFEQFDALEIHTPAWVSVIIGVCLINLGISITCFVLLLRLVQ